MRRSAGWLSALAWMLAALLASPLAAQDVPEPLPDPNAELRERLERAEAEIAALRESLQEPPATADLFDPPPDLPGLQPVDGVGQRMTSLESEWQQFKADAAKIKYPTVQVHGVFQADAGWFNQDEASLEQFGDIQDGAGFRRTRLSANGSVVENVNYFVQMDFGFFGRPTFTDVWLEVTQLPVLGNVRVGQWKQPFALETVTSFRYQTFMERSVLFQTFEAFRHIGIGFYDHAENERMTWAASVFRTGNDQFGNDIGDNGGVSMAGRVTFLPWYDEESNGRYYAHFGGAYYRGDPSNDMFRYATIPEFFVGAFGSVGASGTSLVGVPNVAHGTPPFVNTGSFGVESFNHYGAESLVVLGPLSFQSEVQLAEVNQIGGTGNLLFPGMYFQTSYFLTGESRPYDRKAGALDRVKPFNNFMSKSGCVEGAGAWEVAARYSYIRLDDENIRGGRLNDFTAGVNWYLNPYTKFQLNYIRAFLERDPVGRSDTDMFGMRAQIDF